MVKRGLSKPCRDGSSGDGARNALISPPRRLAVTGIPENLSCSTSPLLRSDKLESLVLMIESSQDEKGGVFCSVYRAASDADVLER